MNELTGQEKMQMGHEAFEFFIAQFMPLDEYSVCLLELLFEMLMTKPYGQRNGG